MFSARLWDETWGKGEGGMGWGDRTLKEFDFSD